MHRQDLRAHGANSILGNAPADGGAVGASGRPPGPLAPKLRRRAVSATDLSPPVADRIDRRFSAIRMFRIRFAAET